MTFVTAEEMKEIDGAAIDSCGIDVLSLMENAGVCVASVCRLLLKGGVAGRKVACLTGKGNNGGDGLVAARHLHNWGAHVTAVLASPKQEMGGTCSRQLATVEAMGIRLAEPSVELKGFDLLIDALLGYSSRGNPREPMAGLIRRANESGAPILAVDIPSGLDPTSGAPNEPCVAARATITLAFPKTGFLNPDSRGHVGELYLGDVSIPKSVYERFGQPGPIFEGGQVVRVW
jgi:NAD(P)H-hydrate epimerase